MVVLLARPLDWARGNRLLLVGRAKVARQAVNSRRALIEPLERAAAAAVTAARGESSALAAQPVELRRARAARTLSLGNKCLLLTLTGASSSNTCCSLGGTC